jgi:hypothetical protein
MERGRETGEMHPFRFAGVVGFVAGMARKAKARQRIDVAGFLFGSQPP